MKRIRIGLMAFFLPCILHAQDRVTSSGDTSVIPVLRGDRLLIDRDLQTALRAFRGQNALDVRDRSVGVVERPLPDTLRTSGANSVVVEGVVLRTDAYLAPDRNGMVTVLTVFPTATLRAPIGFPAAFQADNKLSGRRRGQPPATPPVPQGATLRFAMAGGTIYFDDNNGATLRQAGVRYPAPGESLVFFADTVTGNAGEPPSAVLLLRGACALRGGACVSVDGDAPSSDRLTATLAGGLATVEAYSATGAPIADPSREGIRGVAAPLEDRYNLGRGDLRRLPGPEIEMPPFTPAAADETFVRAHILRSDASLTTGGAGIVTVALATVQKVYAGAKPREGTMEITQRAGFLWKDSSVLLPAFTTTLQPVVNDGDYFLTVGRTSDNRWELRAAWRVVDDHVFALDRPRAAPVALDGTSYWKSTALFLKTHGIQ